MTLSTAIYALACVIALGTVLSVLLVWSEHRYEAQCAKILPLFDYNQLLYAHEVVASCTLPRGVAHRALDRLEREGRLVRVDDVGFQSALGKRYRRLF